MSRGVTDRGRPTGEPSVHRGLFAATLAIGMGIGPMAVVGVNALSPIVVPALELSRAQLGSLTTVAFGMAGFTSVLAGRQVDRFGGRRTLFATFVAGGVASAVMATSMSLAWLWLGALFAGVALALGNPVTNQLISDHIPPGRRGLQIGVKQSGVPMAQSLVGLALPPLAILVGWRGSLLLGVLVAVLGTLFVVWVIPVGHVPGVRSRAATKEPLDPIVWRLTAYSFVLGIGIQPVMVYAPLYAFERVGLGASLAGMTLGIVGGAGMVARVTLGHLAERSGDPIRILTGVSAVASLSVAAVLVSQFVGAWALWPGLIGFGVSALASNSVVMLAVIQGAGSSGTGRPTGVVSRGVFLGFMVGPVLFGALVDRTDSYTVGWGAVTLLFLASLAMTLVWRRRASTATVVAE